MAQTLTVGGDTMAYETKVILKLLANHVARAESLEEVYIFIQDAANAEGLEVASYDEARKKLRHTIEKNRKTESGE